MHVVVHAALGVRHHLELGAQALDLLERADGDQGHQAGLRRRQVGVAGVERDDEAVTGERIVHHIRSTTSSRPFVLERQPAGG